MPINSPMDLGVQADILNGPSKDQLVDAFKYALTSGSNVEVTFVYRVIETGRSYAVQPRILGIRYEADVADHLVVTMTFPGTPGYAEAFYSTRDRKGQLGMSEVTLR